MKFRPCIDIHNGRVKQIVGGSLRDDGDYAEENFVAERDSVFYARLYARLGLRGGHVIILNGADSPYYEASVRQAAAALSACPGALQAGGGITAKNAGFFLEAGASHVIVTSYVFQNGKVNYENLEKLVRAVGKKRLVLDLSCRRKDNAYYIVTDRWQNDTDVRLEERTLDEFSGFCDEFLIHAVDVEGKSEGIERELAALLGGWGKLPVTYAGGVHSFADLEELKRLGKDRVDVTVGSALSLFGGTMALEEVIERAGR